MKAFLMRLRARVQARPVRCGPYAELDRNTRVVLVRLSRALGLGSVEETLAHCIRATYEEAAKTLPGLRD